VGSEATDPPQLILRFVDGLPAQAKAALCQMLAFLFDFVDDREDDEFLVPTSESGEETLKRLLSRRGLALLGATVSVAALIDFAFTTMTHVMPKPEIEDEQSGDHGLARRLIRDAAESWGELRQTDLSMDAIEDFLDRMRKSSTSEPAELTGTPTGSLVPLVELAIPVELVDELKEDFLQGPILDDEGRRLLTEEEVDRIDNLVVVIQAREHPPPHFHVRYRKENASFSISDCMRLPGVKGLEKFERNIKKWWTKNKCTLISVWNRTRPTDCVVGPMEVPEECKEIPTS
jgi:hypothetical protein